MSHCEGSALAHPGFIAFVPEMATLNRHPTQLMRYFRQN